MSGSFLHTQVSKSRAKKRAYNAFSIYMRTLWTQDGYCECYTCGKHLILGGSPGGRVTVGHWVEGHSASTYINQFYVRPQCFRCNLMLGGNQGEFRDRIRKELGNEMVDELLIKSKQTVDISASEYIQLEGFYKQKLKELDK